MWGMWKICHTCEAVECVSCQIHTKCDPNPPGIRYQREMRHKCVKNDLTMKIIWGFVCKGFYSNKRFRKHKCVTQNPEPLNPKLLQAQSDDTIDKDKDFKQILNEFRDGKIGDLCRTNKIIKMIGYRHFCLRRHESGKKNEVRKVVMAEMRELVKLFETFQSLVGNHKTVEDMFSRQYLCDVLQSIQILVTNNEKRREKHGQKFLLMRSF